MGDATVLPIADGSLDHVIASEVLEHIPADHVALAEFERVLKPGGRVAVTVPRAWPERICWALSKEYSSSAGGHVRIYSHSELTDKITSAGVDPLDSHHAHSLHSPYWWLRCLVGVDDESALPTRALQALPRMADRELGPRRSTGWSVRSIPSSARVWSCTE